MFKMGCAKCDVTPEFPVYLRGYATRNKLTDKVDLCRTAREVQY